jgi:hypothetical protein
VNANERLRDLLTLPERRGRSKASPRDHDLRLKH